MKKVIKCVIWKWLDSFQSDMGTDRAWIELDLRNLRHNVQQLNALMPGRCQLMAVVKAEAYGHGASRIAACLQKAGVKAFAVATIDEGIQLRHCGITGEILVLGYTCPSRAKELQRYDLMQTLIDYDYALALDRQGYGIKAHIKVDSGMHRLGYDVSDFGKVSNTFMLSNIRVEGIYTHLCVADSLDDGDIRFTKRQIERFRQLLNTLTAMGIRLPKVHMQSSYGLLNYSELDCDYVRVGIALYGVSSSPGDRTKLHPDLRPVLSLKSRVVLIKSVPKGESVGYGRSFTAERDSKIAMVPIGYADGIPRKLSCGRGSVLINGHRAPIVGRICMDQLAVDVTDVPCVETGMFVTLIGKDGAHEITAASVAADADTITNEFLSRLGQRLLVVAM